MSDSLRSHGLQPTRLLHPWDFPGKRTGVGSHCLLHTIHLVVPNSYSLLSLLPTQVSWFTCFDLKDAFFCPWLSPANQPLFAFEWKDLHWEKDTQLTWTPLLQGFKSSPTLFGETLSADLAAFPGETLNCTLLQYMDDLLLASPTQGDCRRGTKILLALLSTTGYKVSWKKAQTGGQALGVCHLKRASST